MAAIRTRHIPGTPGLAVDESGTCELVLFMHGIGGNRTNWTRQVQKFGEHFLAVAWDARGASVDWPAERVSELVAEKYGRDDWVRRR